MLFIMFQNKELFFFYFLPFFLIHQKEEKKKKIITSVRVKMEIQQKNGKVQNLEDKTCT